MTNSNKGLRILLVEDNPGDQNLITELLYASVIKIQLLGTAGTLAKSIELFHKEIFDVILLDLTLPDSTGIDTFKVVKKVAGKIPVIILSGLTDMNIAVEAITLGAQDYLLKEDMNEYVLTKMILYSIERESNMENLRKSEEKYRSLVEYAGDMILIYSFDGTIHEFNNSACTFSGYSRDEFARLKLNDILVGELIVNHEKYEEILQGDAVTLNRQFKRKDGVIIELEVTAKVQGDGKVLAFGRDITERKNAEDKIRESEMKYRTLFEQSPAGIYQTTLLGKIITCNDAFAGMLGYRSFAELPVKDSSWFYFSGTERNTSIAELLEKGELINQEIMLKHKDGSPVYLVENCFLRKDTITCEDIIEGMMIDITRQKKSTIALRESEEKYRIFFESSMDGILLTAADDGAVLAANPAACNMFGMTEQEICLAGRKGLVDKDDLRLLPLLQQRNEKGKAIGELTFIRKDGSKFPAELSSALFLDAAGKKKTSMIIRDISERKKNEEALIKSELYLRGTLDSTNDGILAIDNNGKVITANNRFAELWHIPEDLISQKDDRSLLEYVVGQLIDPEAFLSKVGELYNSDRTDFDMLHFRDNREFERYSTPLILNKIIVGRVWSFRDVTEQKRAEVILKVSEQNLRQVLSSTADNFYVIDRNCNITLINESAEKNQSKAWGKPVTVGINIIDAIPQEKKELLKSSLDQVFAGKKVEYEIHHTIEGLAEWVLVTYMPVNDDSGAIIGVYIVTKDISERKKAELALTESEEKYRSVIEQATDFIMITDVEGNFSDANSNFYKTFGFIKNELMKLNINKFIDPEQLKEKPVRFDLLLKGETILNERRMVAKNGTIIDVEANVKLLPDGRILAIARDIRDRKKTEARLKEQEEQLRLFVEHSPASLAMLDKDMRYILVSKRWMTDYNLGDQQLIGKSHYEIFPGLTERWKNIHQLCLAGAIEKSDDDSFTRADGSVDWVRWEIHPWYKASGEVGGIIMFTEVVTERKKAQEEILDTNARFHMLTKATSDIVWDWNMLDDSLWWNDNYYSLLGIKKVKEITVINDWYSQIHPDDLNRIRKDVEKGIRNNVTFWSHEYRFKKADGAYLHFLDRSFIMRNQDGQPYRMIGSMVNMTPIYEAQKVVAESENRLRTIYETEPECIKLLGREGELLEMNPAGLAMIEAENLEMVKGKSVLGIVAPAYRKAFEKLTRDVFKGKSGTLEFEIIGLKGAHRWLETHAVPMRDPAGTIIALLGVTINITERKKAEQAVKESEEKFRTMIEQAPDGIFISDQDAFLVDVNTSGCIMLGYSKEELLKMKYFDLISPENLKNDPLRIDDLMSGKIILNERKVIRKDGSEISVEINAKLSANGLIQSYIRDVTDRNKAEQAVKESEEKYRTLVEQAVDAIALYDATGKILDVNTGSANLLGYTKKELLQMSLSDVLTAEEIKLKPVQYDLLRKGNSTVRQRKLRRKDKSIVETEVRSQQLPDGRFLSVIRDLTERIQAETELETSYQAIRKLTSHLQNIREEERTSIAREIHDELGQQLTVMKMDVSWLKKEVGIKNESVNIRLKELIGMLDETVKSVRRISSQLRPSLLDDLGLAAAIEWQLQEFEKKSGIITRFITSTTEIKLPIDIKTALYRIFQESMTNVARHSKAKNVRVNLSAKNNKLILSITDDGKGFDKREIADKKTLGILGMKERTSMIGGIYKIESIPGNGTVATVAISLTRINVDK